MKIKVLAVLCAAVLMLSCKNDKEVEKLVVDFTADKEQVVAGESVTFSEATQGNARTFYWTFEGGTPPASTSPSTKTIKVAYNVPGMYSVTLRVTNSKSSDEITKTDFIKVGYGALSADFEADKTAVPKGGTVTFTDKTTGMPASWQWTFASNKGVKLYSTEQNPQMTFTEAGVYTVTLIAINSTGTDIVTKQRFIKVNSDLTTIIYSEKNHKGTAVEWEPGEYTNVQYKIASLTIPDGLRVKLYRDEKYDGGYLGLEESQNDLTQSGWYLNIVKVVVEDFFEDEPPVKNYNYVLGTQIFMPFYGLTGNNKTEWTYDAAKEMYKMGSNVLKTYGESIEASSSGGNYKRILRDFDFRYVYLWVESNKIGHPYAQWGEDLTIAYDQMYRFAKNILTDYNNTGKTFYLGHWEGDWMLLGSCCDGTRKKVGDENIQGMIDWLNIRQKAIDDAKRDTPHTNVNVWQYCEANRVTDIANGSERVVNTVLSQTTVDYLSYSSYDIQHLSSAQVRQYINYMDGMIPAKAGVPNPGKRVFIGEMCKPASWCDYNQERHNRENLDIFINFFDAGVSQILYWEMFSNEEGYYLIDEKGVKWKLYYSYKAFYCNAKEYVRGYIAANGKTPGSAEFNAWALGFLKTLR